MCPPSLRLSFSVSPRPIAAPTLLHARPRTSAESTGLPALSFWCVLASPPSTGCLVPLPAPLLSGFRRQLLVSAALTRSRCPRRIQLYRRACTAARVSRPLDLSEASAATLDIGLLHPGIQRRCVPVDQEFGIDWLGWLKKRVRLRLIRCLIAARCLLGVFPIPILSCTCIDPQCLVPVRLWRRLLRRLS